MTHLRRPQCWERLNAGEEGDGRDKMVGWHHWLMDMSLSNSGSRWWMAKPDVLLSMGSQRVRHNWVTELIQNWKQNSFPGDSVVKNFPVTGEDANSISGSGRSPGEGNGRPLQYSCLGNPLEREAWWATDHEVTKSWTQLNNWKQQQEIEVSSITGCHMILFDRQLML